MSATLHALPEPAHPPLLDAATPATILIVDDDNTNRLLLRSHLNQAGYQVLEARDGAEAVEMYNLHQPHAVLMDVMMPVMDGYEATRIIRQLASSRYVPIIFLTALTDERSLARCVETGGVDFITKPYNKTLLKLKLEAVLRIRTLYAQLEVHAQTISAQNDYMQQEQETAERIFSNMVHRGHLLDDCFDYRVAPSAIFNGDLLLAMRLDKAGYRILIGDFTGHGLPAAVGAIPVAEIFYAMTAKQIPLNILVREINRKLKAILPAEIFLSLCVMDVSATQLEIWNGGIPDILVKPGNEPGLLHLVSQHPPAGILPDASFSDETQRIELTTDSCVYAYSDGVTEISNSNGEMFGEQRLQECLLHDNGLGAVARTWAAVAEFTGVANQIDDMTMIEIAANQIPENLAK